jgi:hypothetical protein
MRVVALKKAIQLAHRRLADQLNGWGEIKNL